MLYIAVERFNEGSRLHNHASMICICGYMYRHHDVRYLTNNDKMLPVNNPHFRHNYI